MAITNLNQVWRYDMPRVIGPNKETITRKL
jgi:hypothetical protein